jgi:hypothetical protein
VRPYLENPSHKVGGVAYAEGPKFKRKYCKEEKKWISRANGRKGRRKEISVF